MWLTQVAILDMQMNFILHETEYGKMNAILQRCNDSDYVIQDSKSFKDTRVGKTEEDIINWCTNIGGILKSQRNGFSKFYLDGRSSRSK